MEEGRESNPGKISVHVCVGGEGGGREGRAAYMNYRCDVCSSMQANKRRSHFPYFQVGLISPNLETPVMAASTPMCTVTVPTTRRDSREL